MKHTTSLHADNIASMKAQGSILGAAAGDALGWPQELPRNNVSNESKQVVPSFQFQTWNRRSGGRYKPHLEVIYAGEYSDDTQLILCTARSILRGEHWWKFFTEAELPTWLFYERGGGRATLQAIRSWKDGISPWTNKRIKQKYFDAGGNGVAMRILPHCIYGASDKDFQVVARDIMANGVATHGHPRALVGALAYGFVLWKALRETTPLSYGGLIDSLVEEVDTWSQLPNIDSVCPGWLEAARENHRDDYEDLWKAVVSEMFSLIEDSMTSTDQGALSTEKELLSHIGCFGKEKGSGTITSAGAIFLASRYAVEPSNGLTEAAFSRGADTDTLASMAGALLGAISGTEWLVRLSNDIQDAKYIRTVAKDLLSHSGSIESPSPSIHELTHKRLDPIELLEDSKAGEQIVLPGLGSVAVLDQYSNKSLSQATRAVSWKLRTAEGQTAYFKKVWHDKPVSKKSSPSESVLKQEKTTSISKELSIDRSIQMLPVKSNDTSVKLVVKNIDDAKFFYERVLGLSCNNHSKGLYRYGNIWLSEKPSVGYVADRFYQPSNSQDVMPHVWVRVDSLDSAYQNIRSIGLPIIRDIQEKENARYFLCQDPSGYIVLVNGLSSQDSMR